MQQKRLGNTDIMVSKICLGTMNWGYQNNEKEAHEQLDYGVQNGINFIDTAEMYAVPPDPATCYLTESYVGNWLDKSANRKDIILATKITGTKKVNPGVAHVRDGR
jgi:aryl-alcohol dehydrogenase-like predicted oxidoreductase